MRGFASMAKVKNKQPAPVQITAEQILRGAPPRPAPPLSCLIFPAPLRYLVSSSPPPLRIAPPCRRAPATASPPPPSLPRCVNWKGRGVSD